jgi:hypothetical protein
VTKYKYAKFHRRDKGVITGYADIEIRMDTI